MKENWRKAEKRKEERLRRTKTELKSKIKLDFREEADVRITKEKLYLKELEKLRPDSMRLN